MNMAGKTAATNYRLWRGCPLGGMKGKPERNRPVVRRPSRTLGYVSKQCLPTYPVAALPSLFLNELTTLCNPES